MNSRAKSEVSHPAIDVMLYFFLYPSCLNGSNHFGHWFLIIDILKKLGGGGGGERQMRALASGPFNRSTPKCKLFIQTNEEWRDGVERRKCSLG